jgi:hypothetical protein
VCMHSCGQQLAFRPVGEQTILRPLNCFDTQNLSELLSLASAAVWWETHGLKTTVVVIEPLMVVGQ